MSLWCSPLCPPCVPTQAGSKATTHGVVPLRPFTLHALEAPSSQSPDIFVVCAHGRQSLCVMDSGRLPLLLGLYLTR